jgi:hypothetical protein
MWAPTWPFQFLRRSPGRPHGIRAGNRARCLAGSAHQQVILAMETHSGGCSAGECDVRRNFGSQSGEHPTNLRAITGGESSERIARIHPSGRKPLFSVRAFRATEFLLDHFPAPGVLKIDVETHETRVFTGARHLLETVRPVI